MDFEEELLDEEMKVKEKVDQNGEEEEGVEQQTYAPLLATLTTTL